MRIPRMALFLMILSAIGCTGSRTVRLQLPSGARIGIVNVLEQQMTHVNVGSLRIDSFTNVHTVDWDIPAYINRTIENKLRVQDNYTFISLALSTSVAWRQSLSNDILGAVNNRMPENLKAYLQQAAEENRLDAIITVSSYDSDAWGQGACFKVSQSPVVTKGYGLFTRKRVLSGLSGVLPVGQNQANAFANIIVGIFDVQPAKLATFAAAPCSKPPLPDFPWEGDLQHLSPKVIEQVKPHVERLSADAVRKALANAGW